MNTSFLILIYFSILSLSSAQSPSPVRDTDGNVLRSGTGYFILPVLSGRGGGVKLAPTSINQTCPTDVVQENNESRDGEPVTFVPANANKDGTILESTDLNIKFPGSTNCPRSVVWQIEVNANGQRVVTGNGIEGNPGRETISNWFKIAKFEDSYKLYYCPTVCDICRPACGDIGTTIAKNGRRSLLLSDEPLKVKFKKA